MSKNLTGIAVLLILFISLSLRTSYNYDRSMRFDEAFSMIMVTEFSWLEMIDRIEQDVHPPLYYVLLRLWISCCGNYELTARLMSVLFGVLTVYATYLFSRDAVLIQSASKEQARMTGLVAAFFVSVTSAQVHWAQEIRMYSLGAMLAIFSSWTLLRAVQCEGYKWWFGYIVTSAAFLLTHNYALFTVASQWLFCFVFYWRAHQPTTIRQQIHAISRLCWSILAITLIYAPWGPVLWRQYLQVKHGYWLPALNVWTVPNCFYSLFFPTMPGQTPDHFKSILVTFFITSLIFYLIKRAGTGMLLTAFMIAGPITITIVLSLVATSIVYDRYFLFTQIFIICGVSFILTSLKYRSAIVFSTIIISVNLLFLHWIFTDSYSVTNRTGTRGASRYILRQIKKGDQVIVLDSYLFPAVKYYMKSSVHPKLDMLAPQLKHFNGAPVLTEKDFLKLESQPQCSSENIWFIGLSRNFNQGISRFSTNRNYHPLKQIAFTQNWTNQTREIIVTQYQ